MLSLRKAIAPGAGVVFTALLLATPHAAFAQTPSFTDTGVVNAASYLGQTPPAVARGELITILGTNLSTSTQSVPLGSTMPTQIAGSTTQVFFNNIPAPLSYVSPTLVNAHVPFELPQGLGTVDIRISSAGATSAPVNLRLVEQDLGVFAVETAAGVIVAPSTPVSAGDVLTVLANGVGSTITPFASGAPVPASPAYPTLFAPLATINGVPAQVTLSVLDQGLVGVELVKVVVPAGVSAPVNLVLSSPLAAVFSAPIGPTGPAGSAGAAGATGATGATGVAGPAGSPGDTGLIGPQGLPGDTGPIGPQGPPGDTGAAGATGITGAQGPKGDPGIDGRPGASSLVQTITIAAGDGTCSDGGVRIATGIDDGRNDGVASDGVLQPGEITSTADLCNVQVARVTTPRGGSCAQAQEPPWLVALAAYYVLVAARRRRARAPTRDRNL
jgi:uncharacterized protein (TIGR03437 family)